MRRAALVLISMVVVILVGDMTLTQFQTYSEVMYPGVSNPVPLAHSDYLPFTLEQDAAAYEVNALGYRSIYPKQAAKKARRVLLLGDSFTYGYRLPYADSYAGQLQAMLPASEVINAGFHDGFSPDAYYAYIMREGLALQPDVIVLNLYSGNDLTDMESTLWRDGAPLSIATIRHYPDTHGTIINPDTFPWYYSIPVLRDHRLGVGLLELLSRLTGHLPAPVSHDTARMRFETVMRLFADLDTPVYVYLFDSPVPGHPSDAADNAFMWDVIQQVFPAGRIMNDTGAYSIDEIIPGDAHFNQQGAGIMARRVYWLMTG